MRRVLVDAGPLVAILSGRDHHHLVCLNELHRMPKPLLSCWAVITEAAWLLRGSPTAVEQLLRSIDGSFLALLPLAGTEAAPIAELMNKYGDLHPQLADATLVYLAHRERIRTVFTLDQRDFSVYRGDRRHAFEIVPEM